jgi:hypothetical protein
MHVLLKRTKFITWLGFQNEPPLTTKDLRKYGYKKSHLDFYELELRKYEECFLDSVCSRYMTRDDLLFSRITKINK